MMTGRLLQTITSQQERGDARTFYGDRVGKILVKSLGVDRATLSEHGVCEHMVLVAIVIVL